MIRKVQNRQIDRDTTHQWSPGAWGRGLGTDSLMGTGVCLRVQTETAVPQHCQRAKSQRVAPVKRCVPCYANVTSVENWIGLQNVSLKRPHLSPPSPGSRRNPGPSPRHPTPALTARRAAVFVHVCAPRHCTRFFGAFARRKLLQADVAVRLSTF